MKKKGFTLIELLAVLVILAIIALIAVPIILRIINDAKTQTNRRSEEIYKNAVKLAIVQEEMNSNEKIAGTCNIQNNGNLMCGTKEVKVPIDPSSNHGISGIVKIDGNKITFENLVMSNSEGESQIALTNSVCSETYTAPAGLEGEGTKTNPYKISSCDDLIYFRNKVNAAENIVGLTNGTQNGKNVLANNAVYSQTANIDLTKISPWVPIGTETNPFKGTYFGNNATMKNLMAINGSLSANGFFGYVLGGTYENLKFDGGKVVCGGNFCGYLIARMYENTEEATLNISNIEVNGTFDGNRQSDHGGLLGSIYGSKVILKINNVKNTSENSAGVSGGIGSRIDVKELIVDKAINTSKIDNQGRNNLGGLFGYVSADKIKISNSSNSGIISGYMAMEYVGGLIGFATNGNVEITNSKNTGSVVAKQYAGGLIGECGFIKGLNITNSGNSATISSVSHSGGLIGYISGSQSENNSSFDSVSNTGEVIVMTYRAGGLIGELNNLKVNINKSSNTGNLSGQQYLGGLIGSNYSSAVEIRESYTKNSFTQTGGNTSNFGGLLASGDANVYDSYSISDMTVTSGGEVGGLGAISTISLENSYAVTNISNDMSTSTSNTTIYGIGSYVQDAKNSVVNLIVNVNNTSTNSYGVISYGLGYELKSNSTIKNINVVGSTTIQNLDSSLLQKYGLLGSASASNISFENAKYLNTFASVGIKGESTDRSGISTITSSPNYLNVINVNKKFKADTNNKNGGYPLLSWQ